MTIVHIEKNNDALALSPSAFDHKNNTMMVLIHSEMCGHCVDMMSAWDSFEKELKDDIEFIKKGNMCCIVKIETSQLPEVKNVNPSFYDEKLDKMLKEQHYGVPSIATFTPQSNSPNMFKEERNATNFKKMLVSTTKKTRKNTSENKVKRVKKSKKAQETEAKKAQLEKEKEIEKENKKKKKELTKKMKSNEKELKQLENQSDKLEKQIDKIKIELSKM